MTLFAASALPCAARFWARSESSYIVVYLRLSSWTCALAFGSWRMLVEVGVGEERSVGPMVLERLGACWVSHGTVGLNGVFAEELIEGAVPVRGNRVWPNVLPSPGTEGPMMVFGPEPR